MTVHDIKKSAKAEKEPKEEVVLEPGDVMSIARVLIETSFKLNGLRTLHRHRGVFWIWTGSYYQLADDEGISAKVWVLLDRALKPGKEGDEPFKPTRAKVGEVVEALKAVSQLDQKIEAPTWLTRKNGPAPRELFACGNGLLHIPTGKLYPPSPDYFNLNASEATFNPNAPPPKLFLKFLDQLFGDDKQSVELLQEWFGYAQSPDTSQQKILLMIGPRRCGKGTLARLLHRLLGASAVCGPTMSSLAKEFGLEPLITRSLAVMSDVRIGQRTDKMLLTERLLSISGEDQLTVPRKFKQAWNGVLRSRLMMLTNELPTLSDGSGAYAGRLMILVLKNSFYGKEDPALTDKLAAELSGILNWAMEGYRRLRKRGHFVQPESSLETLEQIESLGAPVKAFVRECCDVKVGMEVATESLWEAYGTWCDTEGRSSRGVKSWFIRNLLTVVPGLKEKKTRKGTDRQKVFLGLRLKPETKPF